MQPMANVAPTSSKNRKKLVLFVIAAIGLLFVGLCGFCMLLAVLSGPPTQSNSSAELLATDTPRPTVMRSASSPVPTTATTVLPSPTIPKTVTPSEPFAVIANDKKVTSDHDLVLRRSVISNTVAIAEYDLDKQGFWDETLVVYSAALSFREAAPRALEALPTATGFELCVWAPFKDMYGKSKDEIAMRLRVSRTTGAKINWKGYSSSDLDLLLTGKGDVFYVHPAMRSAWIKFKAGK